VEITNQKIYTHPMKGTIDAAKENAVELLKNDVKEKAEHYTVVDLLRNDLRWLQIMYVWMSFKELIFCKLEIKISML
jgi:para-aminobenzoate synthetase component 1